MTTTYGSLNANVTIDSDVLVRGPQLVVLFGQVKEVCHAGGNVSPGQAFDVSKPYAIATSLSALCSQFRM